MSGTSMDAVDAVLVDFAAEPLEVVATHSRPLPEALREALLRLASGRSPNPLQCLGELDGLLGDLFAETALELLEGAGVQAEAVRAIGSHGQTVYHQPEGPTPFTLQIADPNRIAQHTGITTVADFRRRDMAVGGQGAPLAPAFHNAMFRRPDRDRAVVNVGGMANVTLLPAADRPVIGFDTGPGNVLMDGWIGKCRGEPYDRDGRWAASARPDQALLERLLADPYFRQAPPKSTGREHFNLEWLEARLKNEGPETIQATLCELTARTIAQALTAEMPQVAEVAVCGGGAHNRHLLERLSAQLPNARVTTTADWGLAPDWVEGAAFAWLARQTLSGKPGNLPSVTGAKEAVVLGGIYPGR